MQDITRFKSGVAGLDEILRGGFAEGASYIIQGRPGAGKTILSNQIAFNHAADGGKVLYVTLLSESHDRLFQALGTLSFFDHNKVGEEIIYLSVFQTLRDDGLPAVVQLLRNEIRRHKARLLVFDGLLNARDHAETNLDVKTFVAEVQGQAAFAQCTVLFLTSTKLEDASPEHTMVDGVIDLSDQLVGARTFRRLQVRKSRGIGALGGLHQFEITKDGITVYPRLETRVTDGPGNEELIDHRITSGCNDLDRIIGGGFPTGSVTLVAGPAGSGKTTLGLHFLSQSSAEEPGLHFGFYETPVRLRHKAAALEMSLPEDDAACGIVWKPLSDNLLDKLGKQLLDEVERRGVRRLFIDGLGAFDRASASGNRLTEFFAALFNRLRDLEVTTMATWEQRETLGVNITAPAAELSALHDNLILLRRVEIAHQLVQTLTVQKIRDSEFDPSTFGLLFTGQGLRISRDRVSATTAPGSI